MPADLDVIAYLADKGYHGRQANGPEVVFPCFFDCGEVANSTKRKLYINTDEGFYDCKVCGSSGGTFLLQKHFGDEPTGTNNSDTSFARRQILDWAADVGVQMLGNNDDILLYLLNERGLDVDTIAEARLGYIGGGWSLTGSLPEQFTREQLATTGLVHRDGTRAGKDFFWNHLLIPYVHRGHVLQIRGRIMDPDFKGGKYMTGPGDVPRLYGLDSLEDADEVIVTEGEFDRLILRQHLHYATEDRVKKIAVVGLAGTGAWPSDLESYFVNMKRIYVGFDSEPSQAGARAADKFKEKMGKRVRILQLPLNESGTKCDWTEYLLPEPDVTSGSWRYRHPYAGHTWTDVLGLLSASSGKRIFSIGEAGLAFRQARAVSTGLKTGLAGLDHTIQPGLLPGQVMVVLAKTGSGKTTLLCNLAYNMRRHRILFISLEMTREEVYDRLRRIYLFHNPSATDVALEYALGNVYICDENRLGEKDLNTLVDEFEIESGERPDVVFVDYLGYYARGAAGNSPYEKSTNAVMQLKAEAKAGRFVVISPSQVNRLAKQGRPIDLDDARDSGAIEETADFLLALFRPDDALQSEVEEAMPTGRVHLALLKSRHGGKDKTFKLVMDLLTLAMVDEMSPAARRAQSHNHQAWRGKTWTDLRKDETAPTQMEIRA